MGYFDNKLRSLRDRLKDIFGEDDSIKELSLPKSGCTLQAMPFLFEQLIDILNGVLGQIDEIHRRQSLISTDDHGSLNDTSNNTKCMARDVSKLSFKETRSKEKSKRKNSKYSDLPMKLGLCVTSYLTEHQLWNSSKGCNLLFTHRKLVIMKDPSLNKWHLNDPLNDA